MMLGLTSPSYFPVENWYLYPRKPSSENTEDMVLFATALVELSRSAGVISRHFSAETWSGLGATSAITPLLMESFSPLSPRASSETATSAPRSSLPSGF